MLMINFRFMDKKLCLKLNGGRQVTGILRGFDPFMNLVVDESIEECRDGKKNNIGIVVSNLKKKIMNVENIWICLHFRLSGATVS